MLAKIVPVSIDGQTCYRMSYADQLPLIFNTVTEAQMYCLRHGIPFQPWE